MTAKDRAQLVITAYETGLVTPGPAQRNRADVVAA